MGLSGPAAVVLAALIPAVFGAWLALRTKNAKRDALEKLVANAVKTKDQDHKDEIARQKDEIARQQAAHREQVEWLQGQIKYYQEMSAPRGQRPDHPPPPQ